MRSRADLREYQKQTVDFILEKRRCALFLDMSLGKTACTLTAIVDAINTLDAAKTLVVAPLRVAKNTWPKEIRQWEHLTGL